MTGMVRMPSFSAYLRHLRSARGMSRAQLAVAAGRGEKYVEKLEQGRATSPSAAVVDELASALGATDIERQHLHDLVAMHAGLDAPVAAAAPAREVTPEMREMVDGLVPHLAGMVDEAWNVLYANEQYARVYRHLDDPEIKNVLVWFFFVPESRAIMTEWEREALLTVGWLRAHIARRPGSPLFAPLLEVLSRSGEFRRMWESHTVEMGRHKTYMLVRDLDTGQEMHLRAQVHKWPDPTKVLQLYLGVNEAASTAATP